MADDKINQDQNSSSRRTSTANGASKGSKRRILIGLAATIALLIIGYAVYAMFVDKDSIQQQESETEAASEQAAEESQAQQLFVTVVGSDGVYAVSEAGDQEQLISLEANETVLAVDQDNIAVATVNEGRDISGVKVYLAEELQYELTLTDNQPDIAYSIYNFEGKELSGMVFGNQPGAEGARVMTFSESNETGDTEYEVETSDAPILVPVTYSGSNILAQRLTCYDCDGPPLVELWEIDTATNAAEVVYEAPQSDVLNGVDAVVSPSGEKVYITATDVSLSAGTEGQNLQQSVYEIFEYDVAAESGRSIYREEGTKLAVVGFSDVTNELLITRAAAREDNDEQASSYLFERPVLSRLNVSAASVRDINLSLSRLADNSQLNNAVYANDQLFFRLQNPGGDSPNQSIVYLLDLGEGSDGQIQTLQTLNSDTSTFLPVVFANTLQ